LWGEKKKKKEKARERVRESKRAACGPAHADREGGAQSDTKGLSLAHIA
jgi:hypothetical protein